MKKYREQMIGEAVIGTDTIDHWNRKNPDEQPLQFDLNLRTKPAMASQYSERSKKKNWSGFFLPTDVAAKRGLYRPALRR